MDNVQDAVYWVEEDARISYVNDAACRLTGYDRDELVGMFVTELNPDIPEEAWPQVWSSLKAAGKRTFETRHRTKDGLAFPVEVSANFLQYRGKEYSCAFVRDITARQQLETRLRQAEKMEALGQLAGGIAHDFNNQLMGIMGYADVLHRRLANEPTLAGLADAIRDLVRRAADLTSQLLAFSRKGVYVARPVDLHRVVGDVTHMLAHSLDKKIRLRPQLEAREPFTLGDASQLQSAILNLALNARDAMPDGGTLVISPSNVHLDDSVASDRLFPAAAGEYVRLTVSDTGTGMEPETRRRAFEPFFTTKAMGKGTGLGLAAVYGTVRSHRGTLGIRSHPRRGTEVEVFLPVTHERESLSSDREALESRLAQIRVLLVEDEEALRDVTRQMLEDVGCTVTAFGDGAQALHHFAKAPDDFDVVILDMVMPLMNGRETLRAMRSIRPDVRALIASGYSLEGETRATLEEGARGFVQKPYDSATLARKILEVLERA